MANRTTPGYVQTRRINNRMAYNAMLHDSTNLSAVMATFEEVYDNLDELDGKISGITYSSDTETVTIPNSIGTYNNETITLK